MAPKSKRVKSNPKEKHLNAMHQTHATFVEDQVISSSPDARKQKGVTHPKPKGTSRPFPRVSQIKSDLMAGADDESHAQTEMPDQTQRRAWNYRKFSSPQTVTDIGINQAPFGKRSWDTYVPQARSKLRKLDPIDSSSRHTKRRRIQIPQNRDDLTNVLSPMDLQLERELYAATPRARTEFLENNSSNASNDYPDHNFESAVVYFADVRNRCSQGRVEKFFKKQPTTARSDKEFEIRLRALKIAVRQWTELFFQEFSADKAPLNLLRLADDQPEMMEYINATSSSPVTKTWEQWLDAKRADIVFAIVGKILEMHAFGHEMFGASFIQLGNMRKTDREMMNENGFLRQRTRAGRINETLNIPQQLPPCFLEDLQNLYLQVVRLLHPLIPEKHQQKDLDSLADSFTVPLFTFLMLAAKLSLDMRREPETIYYFVSAPPPGSDYGSRYMTASNAAEVQKAKRKSRIRNKIMDGEMKEVAKITGWPSCIAYRKGSGKDGKEYISEGSIVRTKSGGPIWKKIDGTIPPNEDGFRTRTIALADVVIGFQQVTEDEEPLPSLREDLLRRVAEKGERKNTEPVKDRGPMATIIAAASAILPDVVNFFV